MRLEIIPAGMFSSTYQVVENGREVGRIENMFSLLKERAVLKARDRSFAASREGALRADYTLESVSGQPRARAEKQGPMREVYRISFDGREVFLRKKALSMRETFRLSSASAEIGSIVRESFLSRRLLFEISEGEVEIPLEIGLFLVWIALMIQRRDASTAAS